MATNALFSMNGYHVGLCYEPDVEKLQRRKIRGTKVWLVDNRVKAFVAIKEKAIFRSYGRLSDFQFKLYTPVC